MRIAGRSGSHEDDMGEVQKTDAGRLLAVDDDPVSLLAIQKHLEKAGYQTQTASGGEAAWTLLDAGTERFDALILDRVMPGLDGLHLLARLRVDDRFRLTPVILQTAAATPQEMLEGFEAGASYYLTKPLNAAMLLAMVKAAVADARSVGELRTQIRDQESSLQLMMEGRFEYRTVGEALRISAHLAHAFPDPERVSMGLLELMVNAVEHGNLGIGYKRKGELIDDNALDQEVARRLELPEHKGKKVEVRFIRDDDQVEVRIRDQGIGFDYLPFLCFQAERAFDSHGRGIAMAKMCSFDILEYRGVGNEVRAKVRLE
jgi:DNA-binding response OmpR family regulator